MALVLGTVLCGALVVACVLVFQRWTRYMTSWSAALQHGCQRPSRYPHRDLIWGYDLFRERAKAARRGDLLKLYEKHFRLYGKTFEEQFFGTKIVNTMEAANLQHVAALAPNDFGRAIGSRKNLSAPFMGTGILSSDGAHWKRSRDLIKPIFSRSEIADIDSLSVHVDQLLNMIPRDGSTIDMQPLLQKLFLDSSTEFLFGRSINSLSPDASPNTKEFLVAFNESLLGLGRRRAAGTLRFFLYSFDGSWKQAYDKVHAFIDHHVKQALEETAPSGHQSDSKTPSHLAQEVPQHRYILLYEMAKQIRDPIELRSQVLNVFVPSRDTVSVAVSNALFQLARNPAVWTSLRREALALGSKPLTFEVLKSLVLFKYVVFETLRLQGPGGHILRTALRDAILPAGGGPDGKAPVFVEKGTVVALNTWGLHHDRDIWGDDAHEFKPQRWIGKRPMWEFVPFLGGPRICPANQQVQTQVVYLLVRLTLEFEMIENRDPVHEYVELMRMITESRNGVKIALIPRLDDDLQSSGIGTHNQAS